MERTANDEGSLSPRSTSPSPPKPTEEEAIVQPPPPQIPEPRGVQSEPLQTTGKTPNADESSSQHSSSPSQQRTGEEAVVPPPSQIPQPSGVQFQPLQVGKLPPTLPDTIDGSDPYQIFYLIFNDAFFQSVAINTNINAAAIRQIASETIRTWHDATREEIKVYFGIMVYMNCHGAPNIETYWNQDLSTGPIHVVPSYMQLYRFQQMRRFFYISKTDMRPGLYKVGKRHTAKCDRKDTDIDEDPEGIYDSDELIRFLEGATWRAWRLHCSQCKARGRYKSQMTCYGFRNMLYLQLLSFSKRAPQRAPQLKRKTPHIEPAVQNPGELLQRHTISRHPLGLKRKCAWCQQRLAVDKRFRSENEKPAIIPRTQWICAECNVHLCKPGSGGNDCFRQFHHPLTATLGRDISVPTILRAP